MIHHRLRTGRWEPVAADVFRVGGIPDAWRQALMVAALAWGAGAVISHRTAAALWRLAGFEPGPVELTVPRGRRRAAPGVVHRHPLARGDVTTVGRIPVTTAARTLIDLAAVSRPDVLEEALDDALRRGVVSMSGLRTRLDAVGRPGRPGVALMRHILGSRDPASAIPENVFERRLLRVLERGGLSEPVLQHEIWDGDLLVAVADFAYPEVRLAIEADGYRWHSGRIRWERDRMRSNRLTLLGWRIVHVTWNELDRRPESVVDAVRLALAARR